MPEERDQHAAGPGIESEGLRLAEPCATTLIALWSGPTAPTATEVIAAIEQVLGDQFDVLGELEPIDDSMLWALQVSLPSHEAPVFLWAENAKPLDEQEFAGEAAAAEAQACRWVIGLETPLDAEDPLSSLAGLMRAAVAAAADPPAVLDVPAERWHTRAAITEYFLRDGLAPPVDVLWTIEVVGPGDESSDGQWQRLWLHTHGLWRCGKPELEMLDVPARHVEAAVDLLHALAERLLEAELPEQGEPFDLGDGIELMAMSWETVAKHLPDDQPGSLADRQRMQDDLHQGARAVICAPVSDGERQQQWRWPEQAVCRLERGEAALLMTRRATERHAARARATWPEFAMAFALLHRNGTGNGAPEADAPVFAIKAGLCDPHQPNGVREHVWFRVRSVEGDRAHGELLNQPRELAGYTRGQELWLDRAAVTDWQVLTGDAVICPSQVGSLRQMAAGQQAARGSGT